MKYGILSVLASSILTVNAYAASTLQSLNDEQMSDTTGQALLYMGTTTGSTISGASNTSTLNYANLNFYKMGFQADVEANLNIKTLQLGCGGVNGADGCDIDIENLALTGAPNIIKADGTPQWNKSGATSGGNLVNERAASSAVLRNPFVEFAIKNPNSASLREVAGVRLSAEGIKGYMTAGTFNNTATTADGGNDATANLNKGGINTFSGYITTAPSPVIARTEPNVKFGLTRDQLIAASVRINATFIGIGVTDYVNAYSDINAMSGTPPVIDDVTFPSWGINIPEKVVKFTFPQTVVTGNRMSQLNLKVDNVPIGTIAVGHMDGPVYMALNKTISFLGNSMDTATFFMGKKGSRSFTVRDPTDTADAAYLNSNDGASVASNLRLTSAQKIAYNNALRTAGVPIGQMGCINSSGASAPGDCTFIKDLYANVTVKQDFKRMHNLPVATTITTGTFEGKTCTATSPCYDFNKGFYLSLQKEALRWPGSNQGYVTTRNNTTGAVTNVSMVSDNFNVANLVNTLTTTQSYSPSDLAARGWWMSFSEPLNFGTLEPTTKVPMGDVLPQVASFINTFFSEQRTDGDGNPLYADNASRSAGTKWQTTKGDVVNHEWGNPCRIGGSGSTRTCGAGDQNPIPKNQIGVGLSAGLGALLGGAPLYTPLGDINVKGVPAVMEMSDLPLTNYQAVVPNCWGNLKFC